MSKELKIGMAIGAVLLVVLIVYLAVPKTDTQVAQNDVTDITESVAQQPDETPAPGASVDESALQSDAPAIPVAEAPEAPADPFAADAETTAPTETASAGEGTNWAKLLETGDLTATSVTPSLRATEQVAPVSPVTPEAPANTAASEVATETAEPTGDEAVARIEVPGTASDTTPIPAPRDRSTETTTVTNGSARTHTIKSGENYSTIAKAVYGDARHYLAIQEANPTLDPARIKPGTVIALPDLAEVNNSSAESSEPAQQAAEKQVSSDEYRVQSGDSLYKIAVKRFGTSNMIDDIYELNKEAIGADSSRLKLGMVLKMPAAPKADAPAVR